MSSSTKTEGAFKDLMGTPTFKFIIGPNKRSFFVHVSVLEKTSKVLKVLAQGPMSEAQEGQAVLEDCSEQVFERFCQFAYTNDYQFVKKGKVVKPPSNDTTVKTENDGKGTQLKNASTELATTQPAAATVSVAASESTSSSAAMRRFSEFPSSASPGLPKSPYGRYIRPRTIKRRKNPTNPWNIFLNEEYGKPDIPFETPHIRHDENAFEVFICHAELYVFADRYDIPSLRDMTLFRIHEIFIHFVQYPERLHEIVKLIEYVYESTPEPISESQSDRLRELVAHYVFTTLTEFMDNKEFVENLLGLQPFMKDLMNSVLKTQHLLEYRIAKC